MCCENLVNEREGIVANRTDPVTTTRKVMFLVEVLRSPNRRRPCWKVSAGPPPEACRDRPIPTRLLGLIQVWLGNGGKEVRRAMNSYAADDQLLLSPFEGREAIYISKGALRVRVFNIRAGKKYVAADVEELPTPGLGFVVAHDRASDERQPLRWRIGTSQAVVPSSRRVDGTEGPMLAGLCFLIQKSYREW